MKEEGKTGKKVARQNFLRLFRSEIVITTYHMFSCDDLDKHRSDKSRAKIEECQRKEWGLVILDEVHLAPADIFKKISNQMKSHLRLGLTVCLLTFTLLILPKATLVREDDQIQDITHFVGPKLYELDLFTPLSCRYIVPVKCKDIQIPMPASFQKGYNANDNEKVRQLLWLCNPNKVWNIFALCLI